MERGQDRKIEWEKHGERIREKDRMRERWKEEKGERERADKGEREKERKKELDSAVERIEEKILIFKMD